MLLIIVRRAAWVFVFCAVAVAQAPSAYLFTVQPTADLLLDTADRMLHDQDNVSLIANQLCRGPLAVRASLTVAWEEQGEADQGWQDKSADVCRAHMVGWIEILRRSQRRRAGASAKNANSISVQSAIAGRILDQRPL